MKLCCIHLPGNVPCPYHAIYVVMWRRNTTARDTLRRLVCVHHLSEAINGAIEDSRRGDWPAVMLAALVT